MLLRYSIPDSKVVVSTASDAWPSKEPVSAFSLTPRPRRFRMFVDAKSFRNSRPTEIISWLATEDAIKTWSNVPGVGCQIEERLQGNAGPSIVAGDLEASILHWDTWTPWVEQSLPHELRADAVARLPALAFSRLVGMDAFVTEYDGLLALRENATHFPTIVRPTEALALIGLWRRLTGDHTYTLGAGSRLSIGKLGYRTLAAQVLVPSLDRLGNSAGAVEHRLARALYARDHIHRAYMVNPGDLNVVDEAFFYLDALLVQVVGALDLLARYAHRKLSLGEQDVRRASWRGVWWKTSLKNASPDLYRLTKPSSCTGALIDLCVTLRNYVHGDPLRSVEVVDAAVSSAGVLHLDMPPSQRERSKLKNAMAVLGGEWGTRWELDEFLLVDVPVLVERVVAGTANAIDKIVLTLEPSAGSSSAPRAVQHLSERLQPAVVEQSRLLLGIEPESWPG